MATDKPFKVEKRYSFCKSLVYAIQAITGEATHDVLSTLVSKADGVFEANEIDITKELSGRGWGTKTKQARDYIYYPGTKLFLGIYVKLDTMLSGNYNLRKNPDAYNVAKYSFKLPHTYVEMSEEEFDNIAVDGMLTNSSFNFDEPDIKRPQTPAERRKKQEEQREARRILNETAKAKRDAKKATKLASKIP